MTDSYGTEPRYLEPGAGAALGHGWKQLWKNFWVLLLGAIIAFGISYGLSWVIAISFSVSNVFFFDANPASMVEFTGGSAGLVIAYFLLTIGSQVLLTIPLTFGLMNLMLAAARSDNAKVSDLFKIFSNYWNIVLAVLLLFGIYFVAGMIALFAMIIPFLGWLIGLAMFIIGIIVICKLTFLPFLLVDRGMKSTAAIKASWKWSNGYAGKVFKVYLPGIALVIVFIIVAIIMAVAAFMNEWSTAWGAGVFNGIDIVFTIFMALLYMWIGTAQASLFHAVAIRKDAAAAGTSPAPELPGPVAPQEPGAL